jgi:hypothetical protein
MTTRAHVDQPPEQTLYARWLARGARVGLVVVLLGFVAQALPWWPAGSTPQEVAQLWGSSAAQVMQATGARAGWSWLARLPQADALSMAGIALLAGCSLPPLAVALRSWRSRGDRAHAALAAAQIVVIVLAASGWLAGGH